MSQNENSTTCDPMGTTECVVSDAETCNIDDEAVSEIPAEIHVAVETVSVQRHVAPETSESVSQKVDTLNTVQKSVPADRNSKNGREKHERAKSERSCEKSRTKKDPKLRGGSRDRSSVSSETQNDSSIRDKSRGRSRGRSKSHRNVELCGDSRKRSRERVPSDNPCIRGRSRFRSQHYPNLRGNSRKNSPS